MTRAWVELDLGAVRRNVAALRAAAGVPLLAVVKANGYGHGAVDVARAALQAGAAALGVATAGEAQELRRGGIAAPVQVLGALLDDELPVALAARAAVTLHEPADLSRVQAAARAAGRPVAVQVKVDLGMTRHGAPPQQALGLLAAVAADPGLRLDGFMTHLPSASAPDLEPTRALVTRFAGLVAQARARRLLPARVHAAASAGLLRLPEARFTQVRSGIAVLGLDPDGWAARGGIALAPALALRARVVRVREVPAGTPVGYGGRWVAPRRARLAVLGIGYADGLPYALTGRGAEVLLQGRRCPLVGTVMMDYVTVDVSDLPRPPVPGEVATLFGRDGPAELRLEEQARRAGVIPYAVACGLGARLERRTLAADELAPALPQAA